jgi:cytosine deaminase
VAAHLTRPEQIQIAFDMPRGLAARVLNLEEYGIMVGAPANFVFLPARNAREALQHQPTGRWLVRDGKLIASREMHIPANTMNEENSYDRQ